MKYYQIREFSTNHPESHDGVVSEEELKTRCEIVTSILAGHSPGIRGWNEALGILLHGEGKDETLPNYDTPCYICKKAANLHEPWCSRGVSKEAYLDASPAPTREEWEAWVDRMPFPITTHRLNPKLDFSIDGMKLHHKNMKQWFREMPVRK